MEITIKLQDIIIKDKNSGEGYLIRTTGTAADIAAVVQELEQERSTQEIEEKVDQVSQLLSRPEPLSS